MKKPMKRFPLALFVFLLGLAAIVALAEMGDKTQLLSLVLAARFRKPLPIVPNWVMRVLALVQPQFSEVVQYLKRPLSVSNEKATTLLGWNPRSPHDALYQAGESIVAHTRRVKAEASKVHTVGQAGS